MDNFLKRRRSDVRFSNELRRVDMSNTSWYQSGQRFNVVRETFSAGSSDTKSDTKSEDAAPNKKKKKRMKKTESGGEKSATSDGSDDGVCWSDYERVPGTKQGEKGSCRPKGSGGGDKK